MSDKKWFVQYSDEFTKQLAAAPRYIVDEFEDMYLQLCDDPRESAHFEPQQSPSDPTEYFIEFRWPLAWISYQVDDAQHRVNVVYLTNAKDLFRP